MFEVESRHRNLIVAHVRYSFVLQPSYILDVAITRRQDQF